MKVIDIYERLLPLHGDPEAFEKEARKVRHEIVESFPEEQQQRLKAMLWSQDQRLSKYKDPIARMNAAVAMLFEANQRFSDALHEAGFGKNK